MEKEIDVCFHEVESELKGISIGCWRHDERGGEVSDVGVEIEGIFGEVANPISIFVA